jgi:hypothetical protein
MAMAFKVRVIRPDDLLNLEIEFRNLRLDKKSEDGPVLVLENAKQPAYLIVHFPPQTIAEESAFEPRAALDDNQDRKDTETAEEKRRREENQAVAQDIASILNKGPARARLSQPSRLVFQIPANSNVRIPYTIEGLLDWTELALSVSPIAGLPETPTSDQRHSAPAIAPPGDTETAIEIPYRLILSPNDRAAWRHATAPVTHAGRTELWHTRLAYRKDDGQILDISRADPAPLRAIWSPDFVAKSSKTTPGWPVLGKPDSWAGQDVLTAMNARDRHELVILMSGFKGYVKSDINHATYEPRPVHAEQVILSALGGWLKSRGNWEPPAEWIPYRFDRLTPIPIPIDRIPPLEPVRRNLTGAVDIQVNPSALQGMLSVFDPVLKDRLIDLSPVRLGEAGELLNISEWVHQASQGRDHYVRIVYEGYLYPFGHRAALIKVTERKFKEVNGIPFAYLAQRMFIVVRKPLKDYMIADSTQEALPKDGRGMPLTQVRFTTLVTPDIDFPVPLTGTQYSFWIRVGGADFPFHAVGRDRAKHNIDFTTALIFVPNSDTKPAVIDQVRNLYNQNINRGACLVPGQSVTYTERSGDSSDNTTLTTQVLYFDTENAPKSKFLPKLAKAAVQMSAVEQLVGTSLPTEIKYYAEYVDAGFDSGNEVFAELVNKVQSKFSADKAGGIATPDLSVTAVTRKRGAIAGDLAKAAMDQFDPKDFFKDVADSATLFGKLKLGDLIAVNGNFDNAPSIQLFPLAVPPQVKLFWQPAIKNVDAIFLQFITHGSTLTIEGVVEQPVDGSAGKSTFSGELTNFSLEFLKVIRLNFDSFTFRSETGQKTDINVQLKPGDDALEFLGDLDFVNELKKIIPPDLFGDGPSLEITPEPAIRAGFAIGLPPVAVGVFALKDVSLGAYLTLPFLNGSPLFDFNVSERERPFNLTVAFFGGGGFFRLQVDTLAVRIVEAAFEFGASASINLGVASGGVYIMAGIYFLLETKPDGIKAATLGGYFRMGGELRVLGLISISLEFYLSFVYQDPGKAYGIAKLTVKVEVLLFSKSVEITVEKTFGGQNGDPVFAEVWETPGVWSEYAGAFA